MSFMALNRKERRTAFLSHWCTSHSSPDFSATRRLPLSRSARAVSTASRTSPLVWGPSASRDSQAASMMCARFMAREDGRSLRPGQALLAPRRVNEPVFPDVSGETRQAFRGRRREAELAEAAIFTAAAVLDVEFDVGDTEFVLAADECRSAHLLDVEIQSIGRQRRSDRPGTASRRDLPPAVGDRKSTRLNS